MVLGKRRMSSHRSAIELTFFFLSRQSLKKYVKANNNLKTTSDNMFDSLFNKALKAGVEKGVFEQPKGPSGGTKLAKKKAAPKTETAKKPAVKKAAAPKKAAPKKAAATTTAKKPAAKKAAAPKKAAPKKVMLSASSENHSWLTIIG